MTETNAVTRIAFDRASARLFDADGHLHVKRTPISKANVCEYWGHEIPDWQGLGLDGERRYKLLRDPDELAKAAETFNNKPLLFDHNLVSADEHDHVRTVGAVSNPEFEFPYLYADLACWAGPAIRTIEDGSQKELSSAYRYTADMTPGEFLGVEYDGVMRGISANHVALVRKGRAGPDVVVGDSMENLVMAKHALSPAAAQLQGALTVYLRTKLAQDASVDLGPIVSGVEKKNFKAMIPAITLGVIRGAKGKLAQDAELEDVAEVIEALAPIIEQMEEPAVKVEETASDDTDADLRAMLKAKGCSDEEIDRICAKTVAAAVDEKNDEDDKKAMDAAIKRAVTEATKGMVSKTAMDAAITQARTETAAHINAIEDARRTVRPWVGDLAMSFDSAEGVLRTTLKMLGKNADGKHADALMDILESCPKASDKPAAPVRVAQDAASAKSFADRFPGADRIGFAA